MMNLRLGINHQSPLIYCVVGVDAKFLAGNQSPIPFDILTTDAPTAPTGWESITNPL